MKIRIKRAYDSPAKNDGYRVLVDRLWPRGVKKQDARIDLWAKELTPSNELRKWFHADQEKRFQEFKKIFRKELSRQKPYVKEHLSKKKSVTLVTAVKDIEHSHIPVLLAFLKKQ